MENCNYPNCTTCNKSDCNMESNDISALLKRRRYKLNPQLAREKQNTYRNRVRDNLPQCDGCECCVLVKKEKQDGFRRVCTVSMRLIEQKVSNSPQWCGRRGKHE